MIPGKAFLLLALLTAGVLSGSAGFAQDRLTRAQLDFEQERDPIRKAQRLPRLGEQMLERVRAQAQRGEYDHALATLGSYQEQVRLVHKALRESGVDAERKPRGFRHAEIHLRSALRTLDDTIMAIPYEHREAFYPYRDALEEIHRDLLKLLFPRRPGRREEGEPRMEHQ